MAVHDSLHFIYNEIYIRVHVRNKDDDLWRGERERKRERVREQGDTQKSFPSFAAAQTAIYSV